MLSSLATGRLLVWCATALLPAWAGAVTVVYNHNAADVAALTPEVDQFRADLGTLNANLPVNLASGRREINWDAVPDALSDPNPLPGSFFNANVAPRARGVVLSTPGTGFLLSATAASGVPLAFGFASDFVPFSGERMFTPLGSTIVDVSFFSPADPSTPALTRGFGAVFEDVEFAGTSLQYFDALGGLLQSVDVATGVSGALSFAGAIFDSAVVARVRITAGTAALISPGLYGPGNDGVVMDDFIFGELLPVPEPSAWLMMLAGLGALAVVRRRA